jgi:hypothetical protein
LVGRDGAAVRGEQVLGRGHVVYGGNQADGGWVT